MNNLSYCRVCLAVNVKMHSLINTPLQLLYENVTSSKLEHVSSGAVCYLCYAVLVKCNKMKEAARRSETILTQMVLQGITNVAANNVQPWYSYLVQTPVEHVDIYEENYRHWCKYNNEKDNAVYFENVERDKVKMETEQTFKNDTDSDFAEPTSVEQFDSEQHSEIVLDSGGNKHDIHYIDLPNIQEQLTSNTSVQSHKFNTKHRGKDQNQKLKLDQKPQLKCKIVPSKNKNSAKRKKGLKSLSKADVCNDGELGLSASLSKDVNQSDSEDDVPLKELRKESGNAITKRSEMKEMRKKTKKEYVVSNLNTTVTLLSAAEQQAAVCARRAAPAYLNSVYKCAPCGRGYCAPDAYAKHLEKHDEARGPHVCPICSLRYRTARLLALHAAAAHERLYTCNTCRHVVHTQNQAKDHQRTHHGNLFECQMCGKSFRSRTTFQSHVRARHAPAGSHTVCAHCGQRFVSAQGLAMHRAKMHDTRGGGDTHSAEQDGEAKPADQENTSKSGVYCASCDIQFASRRAWTRHILTSPSHLQLAERTKQCPICQQAIEGAVGGHMRAHDRETKAPTAKPPPLQLQCDQCPKMFATRSRVYAHVRRMHLGLRYDKNLVCETCGKHFTCFARLRYHQRTHSGERPHACAECGKRFVDRHQLRTHARTHTGERPYLCRLCGKAFAQKPALNRHNRVHLGIRPHSCDICGKSFTQNNSLTTHINSVHLKMPKTRRTTPKVKNAILAAEAKKTENVNLNSVLTTNVSLEGNKLCNSVMLVALDNPDISKMNVTH